MIASFGDRCAAASNALQNTVALLHNSVALVFARDALLPIKFFSGYDYSNSLRRLLAERDTTTKMPRWILCQIIRAVVLRCLLRLVRCCHNLTDCGIQPT